MSSMSQAVIAFVLAGATETDGLTQQQIGTALGISQPSVSRILRRTPGFAKTPKPITHQGYWFDVSKIPVEPPVEKSESVTKITPEKPRRGADFADKLRSLDKATYHKVLRDEFMPMILKYIAGEVGNTKTFTNFADAFAIVLNDEFPES